LACFASLLRLCSSPSETALAWISAWLRSSSVLARPRRASARATSARSQLRALHRLDAAGEFVPLRDLFLDRRRHVHLGGRHLLFAAAAAAGDQQGAHAERQQSGKHRLAIGDSGHVRSRWVQSGEGVRGRAGVRA
jgi:hypothetical protein